MINPYEVEVERLTKLAADAIMSLTDEIGTGDDPVAFVCAAYVESRREIRKLREEIEALNEGACRFHCRMRKDMWKEGFRWEQEHWPGLHLATCEQIEEQYRLWRTQHDRHDNKEAT